MSEYDVLDGIMRYENGEMDEDEVLELFSHLVKNGMVWSLQGSYGRMARNLIDAGLLSEDGEILR